MVWQASVSIDGSDLPSEMFVQSEPENLVLGY